MAFAIFASLMMSLTSACASALSGTLRRKQTGEHLDAGQRVLDLVRHHRGHLADRGEAIAQPFAFFHLLDVREVLEEQRGANRLALVVADERQGVADDGVGRLEAQLGAVGQGLSVQRRRRGRERCRGAEKGRRRTGRPITGPAGRWKSRRASSFSRTMSP